MQKQMEVIMSIDYIDQLIADAGVVELRHFNQGRINSALFDDADKLRQAISAVGNCFTTLNSLDRSASSSFGAKASRDDQVIKIVKIPFDFDPVRPPGVPSTREELDKAKEKANECARYLRMMGWPDPLMAMSGNGWHLQYRTILPATSQTKAMFKVIYQGLKKMFSDDLVEFDATVRNPSRILRLYGTTNSKGIATDQRPHRKAFHLPIDEWHQVRPRQVEQLARRLDKPKQMVQQRELTPITGAGDYSSLDAVRWFSAHGLYEHHLEDNIHAVACPWEHEHSGSSPNDTIIYETDGGWPGFYCHHAHCEGRRIRDVIALLGDADQFCTRRFA